MRYVLSAADRVAFVGEAVRVELSATESIDRGFGPNNMHGQPILELVIGGDGGEIYSSWMDQALPARRFVHYDPIPVEPGTDLLLGMWDAATMIFIERARSSGNPRGYRPFWKVVGRARSVGLRWSDNVMQRRAPIASNLLELEIRRAS
jgi:hypothetical protein